MFSLSHVSGSRFVDISKTTTEQTVTPRYHEDSSVLPSKKVELDLHVRVLNKDWVCVVVDPTSYLESERLRRCEAGLADMDGNDHTEGNAYQWRFYMANSLLDAQYHYFPVFMDKMKEANHWLINAENPTAYWCIPYTGGNRTFRAGDELGLGAGRGTGNPETYFSPVSSEYAYYCFMKLPSSMVTGTSYDILDKWGNHATFTYDEEATHSWAIKVNQLGYLSGEDKRAYLSAWVGQAALSTNEGVDFSSWAGARFDLRRVSDGVSVYNSTLSYVGEDRLRKDTDYDKDDYGAVTEYINGEYKQYMADFSAYTTAGDFFVQVDGIGKSWDFTIGTGGAVYGELFYHHARCFTHQRGTFNLTSTYTYLPFDSTDYAYGEYPEVYTNDIGLYKCDGPSGGGINNKSESYGWYDVTDSLWYDDWTISKFGGGHEFQMDAHETSLYGQDADDDIKWTGYTTTGWHDAADKDRGDNHLVCVNCMVTAYLANPTHFTDSQLNLPESGDGVPDLLSEASIGIDWIVATQAANGGAVISAEQASGRRNEWEGGGPQDGIFQGYKFFTGQATRYGSFDFAAACALLGKAYLVAGKTTEGNAYIAAAEDAFDFAEDTSQLEFTGFGWDGHTIKWVGMPDTATVYKQSRFWAAVMLRIATEDSAYSTILTGIGTTAAEGYMHSVSATSQNSSMANPWVTNLFLVHKYTSLFNSGWGTYALNELTACADEWEDNTGWNLYRDPWKKEGDAWEAGTDSSSSTVSIGLGAKTLTVGTGKGYTTSTDLSIVYDADNYMFGDVTSYNSGTGVLGINITRLTGSGSYSSWTVGGSWEGSTTQAGAWKDVNWGWRTSAVMGACLLAYEASGTQKYMDAAIDGMNYYLGCNCHGRTRWSGIGHSSIYHWLLQPDRPDWGKGEWYKGAEIYGNFMYPSRYLDDGHDVLPWKGDYVYNTFYKTDRRAFRQLPEPYNDDADIVVREAMGLLLPAKRCMYTDEGNEIAMNEFTVHETYAPAVLCSAMLVGSGWTPSTALKNETQRSEADMFDSRFYQI